MKARRGQAGPGGGARAQEKLRGRKTLPKHRLTHLVLCRELSLCVRVDGRKVDLVRPRSFCGHDLVQNRAEQLARRALRA